MDSGNNLPTPPPPPPSPLGGPPNYLPDYRPSESSSNAGGKFPDLGDPRNRSYGNYNNSYNNAPSRGGPKLPKSPGMRGKFWSILISIAVIVAIIAIKVVLFTAVRSVTNPAIAVPSFSVPTFSFAPLPSVGTFGLPTPIAQAGTIAGHGYNYPLPNGWQSTLTAADKDKYDSQIGPSDNSLMLFDTEASLSSVSIKDQANYFATTDKKYNWTVNSVAPGTAVASEASYEIQETNADGNQRITLVVSHAGALYALDMEYSPTLKATADTTVTTIINGWKWSQ